MHIPQKLPSQCLQEKKLTLFGHRGRHFVILNGTVREGDDL